MIFRVVMGLDVGAKLRESYLLCGGINGGTWDRVTNGITNGRKLFSPALLEVPLILSGSGHWRHQSNKVSVRLRKISKEGGEFSISEIP